MKKFDINDLLSSVFNDENELDIKVLFDEKLVEYNLSKTKALKILNIDKDVFDEIVSGTAKQPSLINVIKISQFIEIEINDVVKSILKNQSVENIASVEKANKATFILKHFDVKMLTKMGFFINTNDVDILINRVLDFFGYKSILEYENDFAIPLFSKSKRTFSDKMKDFWIKSAYQSFKTINNPNEYNRESLKELIVKIKPYSQDVNSGLYTVCKALYNIGITVIFQNQLPTTQVRGGTFVVNGKPCIVITDLFKKYPTIWFTLLHELNHVLFDLEVITNTNYHLSGENDLFLIEDKANNFAKDFFFSQDKFLYIKPYIDNKFLVAKFAKENEIHASFIYSAFAYYQSELYGKNYYGAFKDLYPNYTDALIKLQPITWGEESLKKVSEKIKLIFELNS